MEILGVITARRGSKRVPGKNTRVLDGRSLVERVIDACENTRITRLIVSTNDPEVKKIANRRGVEVQVRPDGLSEDLTPDLDVFRWVLGELYNTEMYKPEMVVHLRPTAPFITPERIDEAIGLLVEHERADSVRSVCKPKRGPQKMWKRCLAYEGRIYPKGLWNSMPSQLLGEWWMQNGVVDVVRRRVLEDGSMTGDWVIGMFMHEEESWCIDTEFDWKVAEALCREG